MFFSRQGKEAMTKGLDEDLDDYMTVAGEVAAPAEPADAPMAEETTATA